MSDLFLFYSFISVDSESMSIKLEYKLKFISDI